MNYSEENQDESQNINKKTSWPKVLLFVFILGFITWGFYTHETNKPYRRVTEADTTIVINAVDLYNQFLKNETLASKIYTDKYVVVKGTITHIKNSNDSLQVQLNSGQTDGSVLCYLANINTDSLFFQKGKEIVVKGKCAGFQDNVKLTECMIVP